MFYADFKSEKEMRKSYFKKLQKIICLQKNFWCVFLELFCGVGINIGAGGPMKEEILLIFIVFFYNRVYVKKCIKKYCENPWYHAKKYVILIKRVSVTRLLRQVTPTHPMIIDFY